MNYEEAKEKALKLKFGWRALDILLAAERGPVNPYRYFGHSLRRSWSYNYFYRLAARGLLKRVPAPDGCRGSEWFMLA